MVRNNLKAYKFKYSLKKLKIFSKLNLYFFNFENCGGRDLCKIYHNFVVSCLRQR